MKTRRAFLHGSAAALGSAAMLRSSSLFAQPAATELRTRQSVGELDPNGPTVNVLRAGVKAMKEMDESNPCSWMSQAQIHLNHCPHGNWFFLPWHRAYIYFFEQICRKASGNPDFSLPYWDWTTHPRLPAAFWGAGNPLFHTRRFIDENDAASAEFVGPNVIERILDNSDFISAVGSEPAPAPRRGRRRDSVLEGTPHNYIHGFVNGDMATFMSPLDPIFWLHHANIDRIWELWTKKYPSAFPDDPDYNNFEFTEFSDGDCQSTSIRVAGLRNASDLGYQYDTDLEFEPDEARLFANKVPAELLASAVPKELVSIASAGAIAINPTKSMVERLAKVSSQPANQPAGPRVRLAIGGIEGGLSTNIVVRAFLNCEYLSPKTTPLDPHYIGSIAFFGHDHGNHEEGGHEHGEHGGGPGYYLDATNTVQKMYRNKLYSPDDQLNIGMTTVPLPGRESRVQREVAMINGSEVVVPWVKPSKVEIAILD